MFEKSDLGEGKEIFDIEDTFSQEQDKGHPQMLLQEDVKPVGEVKEEGPHEDDLCLTLAVKDAFRTSGVAPILHRPTFQSRQMLFFTFSPSLPISFVKQASLSPVRHRIFSSFTVPQSEIKSTQKEPNLFLVLRKLAQKLSHPFSKDPFFRATL